MTVERYDSIRAAQAALRAVGGEGFASQRYSVLRAVERSFWRCSAYGFLRHPRFTLACWTGICRPFRTYVVRDDAGPVLCAPLQREPSGGWSVVAGAYIELDYVDFVYAKRSEPELTAALDVVLARLAADGIGALTWAYLVRDGFTFRQLAVRRAEVLATYPNAAIPFGEGDYETTLGRHARGNLQCDRNRLRRAGLSCRLRFLSTVGLGERLDTREGRAVLRRCRAVYLRRQRTRYGHRGLGAWAYFRFGGYVPLSIPGEDSFCAALEIDGCIGAYVEGYVNGIRRALEIPRVAMDGRFAAFGPGRRLIVELVRWLQANSDIRTVDLCRGDERYKSDLGGIDYRTCRVRVRTGGGE